MAANKTFTELEELTTVDKNNDWMAVVDVSDKTASIYGTTKKANVEQFIGDKGDAATVDAGTTTTGAEGTNASVVNSGTTSAAVFNFTIPRGNTGATGATGSDGADGDSAYVYIAYASDASGTGFTTTFNAALDYIAVKATTTEITTPQASDFTGLWKNYKGATGAQGIQGETGLTGATGADGADGTDGVNAYVYIAYASDNSGTGFTTTFDANLDYVAIKTTTTEIVTPQASDFTGLWKNYKGATGPQGIQGIQGVAGTNGTDGTDGLDITWKGAYDNGTGYVVNDAVFYSGSSYICKLASTGNLPTNTTYWDLMAQQGAAGAGSGDVSGPASATDNAIARFDLATGKLIQNSLVTVDDNGSINIPSGQQYLVNGSPVSGYSDEQAQDAVGGILTDSAEIDFTYDDATPSITATLKSGSIDEGKLDTSVNASLDLADNSIQKTTNITALNGTGIADGEIAVFNLTNKDIRTSDKTIVTTIGADDTTVPTSKAVNDAIAGFTSYTDEMAQDAVGGILVDTTTIDLTYTDATPEIKADVKAASLDTTHLASGVLDTDLTSVSASDNTIPSAKATKAYVDAKGFTWKGAWATATAYALNDTVESNGSGYVCTSAHTSGATTEPGVGASWTDKWDLFVEGLPEPNLTTATTTNLTGVITGNGSVIGSKANPTGDIVGTTDTQTLTNKTLTNPTVNFTDKTVTQNVKCWVYLSSPMSDLTVEAYTKVLLDAETYDTGSDFASYKFTAPVSGYYLVSYNIAFNQVPTDSRVSSFLYVDGAAKTSIFNQASMSANATSTASSCVIYLAASSYLELYCRVNGAGVDVLPGEGSTYLNVILLSL